MMAEPTGDGDTKVCVFGAINKPIMIPATMSVEPVGVEPVGVLEDKGASSS